MKKLLLVLMVLSLAALACNAPLGGGGSTPVVIDEPTDEPLAGEATDEPATDAPGDEATDEATDEPVTEAPATEEPPGGIGGGAPGNVPLPIPPSEANEVLVINNGQPQFVALEGVESQWFFDFADTTDRVIFGPKFPDHGAGPANLSVTPLWVQDVNTGQQQVIVAEEVVVDAKFSPDGRNLVYLMATADTYELHWVTEAGTDTVIASSALMPFSVSPDGTEVAFTRQSRYAGIVGDPGVYVVDVATGEERQVSDVDREGSGSVDDYPVWSPDGSLIMLQVFGGPETAGLVVMAADGSFSRYLEWDDALAGEPYYGYNMGKIAGWTFDNRGVVGYIEPGPGSDAYGTILLTISEDLTTITSGTYIDREGFLLGWGNPSTTVWVTRGSEWAELVVPVPLPIPPSNPNDVLVINDGEPEFVTLEGVESNWMFDFSDATDRILFGPKFPDHGDGPSNLSVTPLWIQDVNTGEQQVIIAEELVVDAKFSPDGRNIVYLLATPETYQLHWLPETGDDRVIASHALMPFSVSPDGTQVAFTRQSRYPGLDGDPGVYVIDLETGMERKISDIDRAGSGSVDDYPVWSPDGSVILLSVVSGPDNYGLAVMAADGSFSRFLEWDDSLSSEPYYGFVLGKIAGWTPDGLSIVGYLEPGPGSEAYGTILLTINPDLTTIVDGAYVDRNGFLIGWGDPGETVWVTRGPEWLEVPLP